MRPETQEKLDYHLLQIAQILYQETENSQIQTLEGIEETVRQQTLKYVTPQIGFFLSKKPQGLKRVESEK